MMNKYFKSQPVCFIEDMYENIAWMDRIDIAVDMLMILLVVHPNGSYLEINTTVLFSLLSQSRINI